MVDTENGIIKLNKVSWRHCREERLADTKNGILKLDEERRRNFREDFFFRISRICYNKNQIKEADDILKKEDF